MKSFLLLFFFGLSGSFLSQKHVFLHVKPTFDSQPFSLQTVYPIQNGPTVMFDHFNYYFSDLHLYHDTNEETVVLPTVHLLKPDTFSMYLGELFVNQLDSLRFMVGVPQWLNTQNSPQAVDISSYPENHPLSFQSPSMYWGWLFGYMHMIVGGEVDTNNDGLPDTYFELHNLGDHNQKIITMPVIQTNTTNDQIDLYLECRVDQWIQSIPLASVGITHGETGFNDAIMANVLQYPVFTQPLSAGINTEYQAPTFFISNDKLHWDHLSTGTLAVFNFLGQCIQEVSVESAAGDHSLMLSQGTYVLAFFDYTGAPSFLKKQFYSPK
jgi:hypothetical protein